MVHSLNVIVAHFALCTFILSTSAFGQDAVDSGKEMQVLSKLLGTWDLKTPTEPAEATYEWILDGRYIQRTGTGTIPGVKILELMTYDSGEKCYRMWTHASVARFPVIEHRGTWDEVAQTITWEAKFKSGATRTTKMKFEIDSVTKWTISGRDANGDLRDSAAEVVATLRKKKN
jgi:hypothetical protein